MGPLGFERLLGQRGETSLGDGSPDCNSHLLQHDQEHAGPQRGAMNLSCGPQVAADQYQQQRVTAHLRRAEILKSDLIS